MMDTFWQDLRYSLRMILKRPGFTAAIVITLALGIGANATIFTWIKVIFLERLRGVDRPDDLVEIWGATENNRALSLSYLDYVDLRDGNEVLSGTVAHQVLPLTLGRGGKPERVRGAIVSGNYFEVLGVKAFLGRTFLPEEDRTPNARPVVVMGHGLWQRRFGGDPNIVGRAITLNAREFTVIGVTPREFGSSFSGIVLDLWTPVMMKDSIARPHFSLTERDSRWLMVMGRLRPGVTVDQARANIVAIAGQLERAYPQTNEQMGVDVFSLTRSPFSLKQSLQPALAVLMTAVAVVLLIACANVANLLLGRAASRRKEIALRLALGGSRQRLVRQMVSESLVLASLGAALGLILAFWAARSLPAFLPPFGVAVNFDTRPDAVVFAFTLALTVATTMLCGLAPALHASKPDLVTALKDTTATPERGVRKVSLRHTLVIAQVALSMVALVSAGLLVRSLREASLANPGFDPDRVLLASFDPFLSGYEDSRGGEFYRRLVERVATLPGVEAATLARRLPLTLSGIAFANVAIDGYAPARAEDMRFNYETVGPRYFQTMRIPLVGGRDFDDRDREGTQGVVIINETMAQRYWPGGDALGGRLNVEEGDWVEIVGIAKDVKQRSLSEAPQPFFYLPLLQDYRSNMILVARTALEPEEMLQAVEGEVAALDPEIPVFEPTTLQEHLGVSLFRQRMAATLLSLFGLLALALAAVGLYGVMAYTVSRRTRELGIRIAVGATDRDVLKLVLGHALILSAIGIAAGVITALIVTRFLVALLYGVGPADPVTFAVIPIVLLGIALAAGYLPARRAIKIDPTVALRIE
ncbi:MAG: FtsX-like permease family protein [Luteitalea sp.]|nr:FtsX-like permease family protein [Luteitalea sp.]